MGRGKSKGGERERERERGETGTVEFKQVQSKCREMKRFREIKMFTLICFGQTQLHKLNLHSEEENIVIF